MLICENEIARLLHKLMPQKALKIYLIAYEYPIFGTLSQDISSTEMEYDLEVETNLTEARKRVRSRPTTWCDVWNTKLFSVKDGKITLIEEYTEKDNTGVQWNP